MTERQDSNYYEDNKHNPNIEQFVTEFQDILGQYEKLDQPLLEIQKQFTQSQSEQSIYKLQGLLNNLQSLLSSQQQSLQELLDKNRHTYNLQEPLNNQQQSLQRLSNEQQQLLSDKPQPHLQPQLLKKLKVLSDKLQSLQSQQLLLQQLQSPLEKLQVSLEQQLQFINALGGILKQPKQFIHEQRQILFDLLQHWQDILLNKQQFTHIQLDILKNVQLLMQQEKIMQEQVVRQINYLEIGENCDPKNTKNTHDGVSNNYLEELENRCRELEIKNKELKRNSNSNNSWFFSDNNNKVKELQSKNDNLENKYQNLQAYCQNLQANCQNLQANCQNLQANCQRLQANCQSLQANCQTLETHRNDLKKANEKLKKEAIKYQSALGNATSFHLGSQDSDSAGQLSDDIRTLHNNLEKFCGLKRGGEVKEPEVKELLKKFGCSITGKINKDHKNLISGLLERYVIETIIEKAKEYFCVQKNDKDNKNDEEQPKGNDDKKLKENDEKTEKTQVDNDKPSKGNDGEKQNGNDGEQDDEKKQQSLEVNIVNTTERLLKMIDSISTSRVGNDEVSKAASTKLRQQIYGVLGNRGFSNIVIEKEDKKHPLMVNLRNDIIGLMDRYRIIKKKERLLENEELIDEIIRQVVNIFFFRLKVQEPVADWKFFDKNTSINTIMMEASWDHHELDDLYVNVCSFPIIGSKLCGVEKAEDDLKVIFPAQIIYATKDESC